VVLGGGGRRLMLATKVGGGGGGVCHQRGVGLWASCLISGSPTLGSCWARWLGGLGGKKMYSKMDLQLESNEGTSNFAQHCKVTRSKTHIFFLHPLLVLGY
jgi:hypothetical protein